MNDSHKSTKGFATSYEAKADEATRTNYAATFLESIGEILWKDSNQLIEHFVLSERHPEANPLFLKVRGLCFRLFAFR